MIFQVITRLSEGVSATSGHIPYRNSNLTRFEQREKRDDAYL